MLLAVADGRALPASVLAAEAGVSPATASVHLAKLCAAGLLVAEPHGRYRYYRLASGEAAALIELAARLSPPQPVRSLRQGTRAHALRLARRCYDHLGGRLAVTICDRFIDLAYLGGGDGSIDPERSRSARLAGGILDDTFYQLTVAGAEYLAEFGVTLPVRRGVRCCVDWTEQRHHLAGPLGRSLLAALTDRGWLRPSPTSRAVLVTATGRTALAEHLGLPWPPPHGPHREVPTGSPAARQQPS